MSFFRVVIAAVLLAIGFAVLLIVIPKLAFSAPICGVEAQYPDFEAGDVVASCSDRHRVCRATILSYAKKESLSVRRKTGTDIWEITLGSDVVKLDRSHGLFYVVDPGEPKHIEGELLRDIETVGLEFSSAKNKILIGPKRAKTVLLDMLKGDAVSWIYRDSTGEHGDAAFVLQGLDKAIAWIACKQ